VYGGFCDWCRFCFVWFDRHSNPEDDTMDDTMLSPFFKLPTSRTDQLITLPSLFCLLCCFLFFSFLGGFALVGFLFWFCFFFVFSFGIVTANRTSWEAHMTRPFFQLTQAPFPAEGSLNLRNL